MKAALATTILALAAFAAPASHAEPASPYFKILTEVPTELRGPWCMYNKGEPTTNPWTGNTAKEYAARLCLYIKTRPVRELERLPDLTITEEDIHILADARCHVDRIGELPGKVYVLKTTCINRTLRNPLFIGTDPGFLWLVRGSRGDLRIVADIESADAAKPER